MRINRTLTTLAGLSLVALALASCALPTPTPPDSATILLPGGRVQTPPPVPPRTRPEVISTGEANASIALAGERAAFTASAVIAPPQAVTNQIDWQFLPIPAATAAALTNGFTAFIEVSTNNGSTWQRIASAPYPPEGGVLHSALITLPSAFIRSRAGYFLNNPTH